MASPSVTAFLLIAMGQASLLAQIATPTSPNLAAYSIAVRSTQAEAKVGEPIIIDITLTNTSDKALSIAFEKGGRSEFTYDFYVADPHGAEAPSKPYLRAFKNKRKPDDPDIQIDTSMKVWIVQSGKSMTTHMDITRLYKIEVPGTYTVWVERLDESTGIRVKSNAVSVPVNP